MSQNAKRQAFSYIRMSTEAQLKGNSLQRQLDLASAYALENNFELIEDLRDIGLSAFTGKNMKNGSLGGFMTALKDGKISKDAVLLVESLDRLSRQNPITAFSLFGEILSHGIEIHTLSDRQIYSKDSLVQNQGQIFTSIGYMLRANNESEEKSKRLKKAWVAKRGNLDNRILTSRCPAWLEAKEDRTGFEIKINEAETVKKIFELCIEKDMGQYSIARYLNKNISLFPKFTLAEKKNRLSDGGSTTGWQKSYITKILNNPAVHGEFQPYQLIDGKRQAVGEGYEDYYPAIISKQQYYLAQSKLKSRLQKKGGRKGELFNNVFTKLVFCGSCGGAVHYIDKGKRGKYLRCSNAHLKNACKQISWKYDEFEKSFFEYISEFDFQSIFSSSKSALNLKNLRNELASIDHEIQAKENAIQTLLNMQIQLAAPAQQSILSKLSELATQKQTLVNRQVQIKQDIAVLSNQSTKTKYNNLVTDIRTVIAGSTEEQKIELRKKIHSEISLLVKEIKLYNTSEDFIAFEVYDSLSRLSLKNLEAKKVFSKHESTKNKIAKITAYFSGANGRHLFDEMERYYLVKFKNNEERRVYPFSNRSSKIDRSKMTEFIKRNVENQKLSLLGQQVSIPQAVVPAPVVRKLTKKRTVSKKSVGP